jgi:hypothetical protein
MIEKQLYEQLETHKQLVNALKKLPEDLVHEFTKDGGIISNILVAEQTTHAK